MHAVIETILIAILVVGMVSPYVAHVVLERTLRGAFYGMGEAYIEVLCQTCRNRFCELMGTFALLFVLCSTFDMFAVVLALHFVHVAICSKIAIDNGHVPGSIRWN